MQAARPTVILSFLLPLVSPNLAAQDQGAGPTVEVVEITARKAPKTPGAKVFSQPGLELTLIARLPGSTVIALDKKATKLTSFTDDTGTDLSAGAGKGFFYWVSMQSGFGDGPKDTVNLTVKTKTLPASKAGRVQLEANVVLLSASGSDTASQKVALKKGTTITAGPVPMKISAAKKPDYGDSELQVELQSSEKLDAIQKVEFLDAAGQPIETKAMGTGSMGFAGKTTYSKSFGLAKKVANATIKITFYKKLEAVSVPLKLDIGLGL